jgi:hypothetical protein
MSFVEFNSTIDTAYLEPDAWRDHFRSLFAKAAMAAASSSKAADPVGPPIQSAQRSQAEALAPTEAVGCTDGDQPPPRHHPDEGSAHTMASTAARPPKRLKHIKRVVDRKGIERIYYSRGGKPHIRLTGAPGSPEFRESHAFAAQTKTLIWEAAQKPGEPARSFHRLVDRYLYSANFQKLSPQTQRVYVRVIGHLMHTEGLGTMAVARLTPAKIRHILAKRHATPAAANDMLKKLRILLRLAIDLRWRPDDPTRSIMLQQAADTTDGRRRRRRCRVSDENIEA